MNRQSRWLSSVTSGLISKPDAGAPDCSPLHATKQPLQVSDGGAVRELGAPLLGDRALHAGVEEGIRADDLTVRAMQRTAQLGAGWILTKGQGR